MSKPKYDVGFYNYPGGIQASNREKTIYGDYEKLAFIAHSATNLDDINWEKEKLPAEIQTEIVDYFKNHIDAFKPEPPKVAKYTIEQIQEAFKNASNYPQPLQWAEKYGLVFRRSATQVNWTEKGIEYFDINGLWKSKRAATKTGPIKSFSEIAKLEVVMFQGTTAIMRGPSGRKFYTDSGFISPKVSSLSWPTEDDQQKVNKCIESNISTEMVATHSQYKAAYVPYDDWQNNLVKTRDYAVNVVGRTMLDQYTEEGTLKWNDKNSIQAVIKRFENGDYPNGRRPLHEEFRNSLGEPDTREGNYYVTAMDGHGTYLLLGPFINRHADALDSVYWVRQVAEKDPKFHHWMKFGTARFDSDYLLAGKANTSYKETYPSKAQPNTAAVTSWKSSEIKRKRAQANAKAAMVMIRALKA